MAMKRARPNDVVDQSVWLSPNGTTRRALAPYPDPPSGSVTRLSPVDATLRALIPNGIGLRCCVFMSWEGSVDSKLDAQLSIDSKTAILTSVDVSALAAGKIRTGWMYRLCDGVMQILLQLVSLWFTV